MKKFLKIKNGQVMVLNAFLVSSIFLIMSSFFGLVIYYQVQQTTNYINSTIAFFAADSALELGLYKYYKVYNYDDLCNNLCIESSSISFLNGATSTTQYEKIASNIISIIGIGYDKGKRTVRYIQSDIVLE